MADYSEFSMKDYRFIIVEFEEEARLLIRRVLAGCHGSVKIFEAASGQEALKLYASHGADLMIVDHQIPFLDGLSLVRFLRAQEINIPLLLTSANPQIEPEAARAGATRFLEKRNLFQALEEALLAWLAGANIPETAEKV
jgi:CheY-like chemotaxis protein